MKHVLFYNTLGPTHEWKDAKDIDLAPTERTVFTLLSMILM